MSFTLKAGGVALPAPVSITDSDQTIWSANTGRTSSGQMVGTVVAEKKTFTIKWGVLTDTEVALIKKHMPTGFFDLTIRNADGEKTHTVYRSALEKEVLGYMGGGGFYYRSLSVTLVEQ